MPQNSFWDWVFCRSTPVEEQRLGAHRVYLPKLGVHAPDITDESVATPKSDVSPAGVSHVTPFSTVVDVAHPRVLDPAKSERTKTSRHDKLTITPQGKLQDATASFFPPKFALDTIVDMNEDEAEEDGDIVVTAISYPVQEAACERLVSTASHLDGFASLATNRVELIEAHEAREKRESSIDVGGGRRLSYNDKHYTLEPPHMDLDTVVAGNLPGTAEE